MIELSCARLPIPSEDCSNAIVGKIAIKRDSIKRRKKTDQGLLLHVRLSKARNRIDKKKFKEVKK